MKMTAAVAVAVAVAVIVAAVAAVAAAAAVSRDVAPSRTSTTTLARTVVTSSDGLSASAVFSNTSRDLLPLQAAHVRDGVAPSLIAAVDIRFAAIDVMIDTADAPLAVYQLEIAAKKGDVKIVGIEGSEHEAFRDPPHYDPLAIQRERVILGAFNTAGAEKLPRGKVRIATIHLQVTGDVEPEFDVKSSVIATVDGEAIAGAKVTIKTRRLPL